MNTPGGRITFGDFDSDNCEADIDYVNLIRTDYWRFKLDSIHAGVRLKFLVKKKYFRTMKATKVGMRFPIQELA